MLLTMSTNPTLVLPIFMAQFLNHYSKRQVAARNHPHFIWGCGWTREG